MKTPIRIFILLSLIVTSYSCGGSDDSEQEPDTHIDSDPIPSQTSTYTEHVKTIIDTHCISCHSNPPTQNAPMSLETFQEVVSAVNARSLFSRVTTDNAFNIMPVSGKLPQATIDIIEDWIADGLLLDK